MKNGRMCSICPWGTNPPFSPERLESTKKQIELDIENGDLVGPHACHLKTEEMLPANEDEICIGHKLHLEGKSNES